MASHKIQRTTEDIRRELTDVLRTMKDPRIRQGLVSVVRVELTNDLSLCKVFISSMNGFEGAKEAVKGLTSGAGYVRREIGHRLDMRRSPEFKFIADDSIAHGAEISRRLGELLPSKEDGGKDPGGD